MRKFSVIAIGLAVVVCLIGSGGAAFAWWETGTSGTGSATVDAAPTDVTAAMTTAPGPMTPGGASQPMSGDFTNSDPAGVAERLSGLQVSISSVSRDGAPVSGCSAADYKITQPSFDPTLITTGAANGAWSASISMIDHGDQSACSGATINYSMATS